MRAPDARDAIALFWLVLVGLGLAVIAVRLVGCTPAHASALQKEVTLAARLVGPTYELAMTGCLRAEEAELVAERDAGQAAAVTDRNLAVIRSRCDVLRAGFDRIVGWLVEAEAALDRNEAERARARLEEAVKAWQALEQSSP